MGDALGRSNQLRNGAHDMISCLKQEKPLFIFILLNKTFISKWNICCEVF